MRFSIVIPVFNASQLVNITIASLMSQTYKDFEVIFVDDGSTDDSYNVIKDKIFNDRRFSIYKQSNKGPGSARNKGILHSKGDYVGFLDADDYFHCDYLNKMNQSICVNSSDIVVSDYLKVDVLGNTIKKYESKLLENIDGLSALHYILRSDRITSMSQNKVFKRELFNNIKFPTDIIVNEDSATLFKLFHKSQKVSFVNEFLFYYVQHPTSTMNSFAWKKIKDRIVASEIVLDYLEQKLEPSEIGTDYVFYYFLNVIFSGSMQISLQSPEPGKDLDSFINILDVKMFNFKNIFILFKRYKVKGFLLFTLKLSPMVYRASIKVVNKVVANKTRGMRKL